MQMFQHGEEHLNRQRLYGWIICCWIGALGLVGITAYNADSTMLIRRVGGLSARMMLALLVLAIAFPAFRKILWVYNRKGKGRWPRLGRALVGLVHGLRILHPFVGSLAGALSAAHGYLLGVLWYGGWGKVVYAGVLAGMILSATVSSGLMLSKLGPSGPWRPVHRGLVIGTAFAVAYHRMTL